MDSKEKKDKGIAVAGTIIVHVLAAVVLLFMAFKTPLPLPEEEGVEVALGMDAQGMGDLQPDQPVAPVAAQPQQRPQQQSSHNREEMVTENSPDRPAIESTPAPKPTQNQPVQNPTPAVDPRAIYSGSPNPQSGDSHGITGGNGNQGDPSGDLHSMNYGPPGNGNRPDIRLANRRVKSFPPTPKVDTEQEIIKVEIRVDRSGRVVSQRITDGYQTTTSRANQTIALDLARRTTFEPDSDAPEEQIGSITYTFTY